MKRTEAILVFLSWLLIFALAAASHGKTADVGMGREMKARQAQVAVPLNPAGRMFARAAAKYGRGFTRGELVLIGRELVRASDESGVSVPELLALIEIESNFKKRAIGKNPGKASDYGLTQQNLYWANRGRCQSVIGRRCTPADLVSPSLSIQLAAFTLKRCGRVFRGAAKVLCYHNWKKAYTYRRTGKTPRYLVKFFAAKNRIKGLKS